jgi:hypothetical protein
MTGTAPLMAPNSLIAGAAVSSTKLTLTHTAPLLENDSITCTFSQRVFASDGAVDVSVSD